MNIAIESYIISYDKEYKQLKMEYFSIEEKDR